MLFKVFHLHPTTMFETQDLWALTLQIPQLYPVDVTPEKHDCILKFDQTRKQPKSMAFQMASSILYLEVDQQFQFW